MSTVKDLKNLAKERGLRRHHNLKNAELLTLLEKPIPPSKKDFKKLAKERGLRRYHNFKKAELLTLLEKPIPPSKKDFKKLAKERGLRRYHNLKKAELLTLLEKPIPAPRTKRKDFFERPIPAPRNILNIRNPSINIPILQPEIAVVKPNEAPSFIKKTLKLFWGG